MARLRYERLIGAHGQLFELYPGDASLLEPGSGTLASYEDGDSGNVIAFEGTGFKYDAGGFLKHGTVTEIHFTAQAGGDFALADQLNFDAAVLMDNLQSGGIGGLLEKAFRGSDRIVGTRLGDDLFGGNGDDHLAGRAGADNLFGDRGDDTLTGGFGTDAFFFAQGKGHDVVTDFDVSGPDHDIVHILTVNDFSIVKHGHDVVITLDSGDSITLLDVRRSEFDHGFIVQDA